MEEKEKETRERAAATPVPVTRVDLPQAADMDTGLVQAQKEDEFELTKAAKKKEEQRLKLKKQKEEYAAKKEQEERDKAAKPSAGLGQGDQPAKLEKTTDGVAAAAGAC